MLAAAVAVVPLAAAAHPHLWISQSVRVVTENGAYTHVEIEWKFDPHASEDEIPAIDEDNDGQFSEEEIRLLVRDMMPELQKSGFLTWLNTGDKDFRPPKVPTFDARIDNPATFTPPEWDRGAGDGDKMPENKSQAMSLPPKGEQAAQPRLHDALRAAAAGEVVLDHDLRARRRDAGRGRQGLAAGRLHARQASDLQVRVRARPAGVRRQGDVPPSLTPPVPAYRPWLGIFFMCVACALFPVQNAVVKLLTSLYPFQEVVWVRLATHLVLMCVVFLPRRGLALLRTRAPVQQVICSAGLLGATFFFFSAAKSVGVTEAIAISFISPLVVTFLAWPILGERITVVRLASVVIGFAGVLIVIRPGSSVFQWASLLIVASSVSYAVYQIIVRRVAAVDSPATTAFYSALGCTLVTSLFVPFYWKTPDNWRDVALMLSLGVSGGFGHYCVARAFSYAPANLIAPLNYTQMIGSVVVGYLVFAEVPDFYTWIGSAVIIVAGLLVGWQGRKKKS